MGTALAKLMGDRGYRVIMWARRKEIVKSINERRENIDYYPGIKLPLTVKATNSMNDIMSADMIFIAVPSHAVRAVCMGLRQVWGGEKKIIVNTAKGVEYPPFKRLSAVIGEVLGANARVVIMSGPNFASEIIRGLPTGTTIASKDSEALSVVKEVLHGERFIVQASDDVIGVELGGVLKNVYAIAMGICDALGVNENAYFFVLTEAFREMREIITRLGGKQESLFLSSGFGDLCLTSSSNKSRNRALGFIAGKEMLGNTDKSSVVLEGEKSIRALIDLTNNMGIRCPVLRFVYNVLIGREKPYGEFLRLWHELKSSYDDR